MKFKNHLLNSILVSGFLLFADQLIKYYVRVNDFSWYVWRSWIGIEYYENYGIGFSLPFPNFLMVIFTPIILFGLIYWVIKRSKSSNNLKSSIFNLSICLILAGAISNYIDRVIFGFTIDYLRIFTGIINLADVMILAGVILLVKSLKSKV